MYFDPFQQRCLQKLQYFQYFYLCESFSFQYLLVVLELKEQLNRIHLLNYHLVKYMMDISKLLMNRFLLVSKLFQKIYLYTLLFWLQNYRFHPYHLYLQDTNFVQLSILFQHHLRQLTLQRQHAADFHHALELYNLRDRRHMPLYLQLSLIHI